MAMYERVTCEDVGRTCDEYEDSLNMDQCSDDSSEAPSDESGDDDDSDDDDDDSAYASGHRRRRRRATLRRTNRSERCRAHGVNGVMLLAISWEHKTISSPSTTLKEAT